MAIVNIVSSDSEAIRSCIVSFTVAEHHWRSRPFVEQSFVFRSRFRKIVYYAFATLIIYIYYIIKRFTFVVNIYAFISRNKITYCRQVRVFLDRFSIHSVTDKAKCKTAPHINRILINSDGTRVTIFISRISFIPYLTNLLAFRGVQEYIHIVAKNKSAIFSYRKRKWYGNIGYVFRELANSLELCLFTFCYGLCAGTQ